MGIFLRLNKGVYANCKSYVYKHSGHSLLDSIFDAYWNLCMKLVPKSVTANFLTLLGFLCSTVAFFLMYLFDLSNKKNDYIYLYIALFLFLYQTFDALDGKQARRTNTSSPLGQLFDHGCDAIISSLFIFIVGKGASIPKGLLFYFILAGVQLQTFMFSWMEHYMKVYNTSMAALGLTESHVMVISVCILRGLKGAALFDKTTLKDLLPGNLRALLGRAALSIKFTHIIVIPVFFFLILTIARSTYVGLQTAKKKRKEAAIQLIIFYVFVLVQYYFYHTTLTVKNELLCYTIIALFSSFYTLHMNMSTVLKTKMDSLPIPIIFYYVCITLLFTKRTFKHHILKMAVFNETYILYYMMVFGFVYLFDYTYTIVGNICKELNITFLFNKKKRK
ncbi:ethanolaminephosphotransferase [Plasmodium inui San Antonio 1]|uniref:Ethanolaminephosphotransferase n=1 Tax=Plasmodium inui San Antonio 1 TaxID=1237626 RepID=W7AT20_9APIC|nr:ethanolaminephosphotransferase [Plasmodium inui San Antonio 1]EUD68596.1 ethanolaminephosphotransferase [Plasmodium inui San Antonio 1]